MDFSSIKDFLKEDLDKVNKLMATSLSTDIELLDKTNRAILSHNGKQVRPVLTLLVARACSGGFTTDDTIKYAAAVELLHNATLLHDDVADDSPVRRGVPTVMSILGGRASVLLGDYWLVKGMENILASRNSSDKVIRIFASTLTDLAEGELLQLQKAETGDTLEKDYYRIIYDKTASLFVASAAAGAISVSATEEKMSAARTYAKCLGVAFQIRDDIFDYEENVEIGKPVGLDLKEKKITLPLLGALAKAGEERGREIRRKLCRIDDHPEYGGEIIEFVKSEGGIEYARKRLYEYVDNARIALRPFGNLQEVEMLCEIAEFTADRKS
mgnify:FL=1